MRSNSPLFGRTIGFVAIVLLLVGRAGAQPAHAAPTVNVILWFDTEDYLLPADDDADKQLAQMLSQRGIHATFKVVGEKARTLQRRGRTDVIEALRQHTIAYHSNFHSVHPAPAEYLADCRLLDGMEEFIRHESRGAADVRKIFSVPSLACYGQPGSSWAPQAIAALGACGIGTNGVPCYVDSGNHIGLHGVPYWYCGALIVYDMSPNETRMDLWKPDGLKEGEQAFSQIADRLRSEGGGLISIYYHPCEWVHQQFWDSVNFARGANPPREQWKAPPQRPPEQTHAAFERFGQYIDYIRGTPDIHFITAAQLPDVYPDRLKTEGATSAEVLELAHRIIRPELKGIDLQTIGRKSFSPADQFALLASIVAQHFQKDSASEEPLHVPEHLLGPDGPPPVNAPALEPLNWLTFRDAALDANDFVQFHHRIPARVFIGPDPVAPADFLLALATVYVQLHEGKTPQTVALGHGVEVLTAEHVVHDSPRVYGGWIIHRANYRAPKILDVARLQAWTLKPAMRGA
jgi:hypothetical protein